MIITNKDEPKQVLKGGAIYYIDKDGWEEPNPVEIDTTPLQYVNKKSKGRKYINTSNHLFNALVNNGYLNLENYFKVDVTVRRILFKDAIKVFKNDMIMRFGSWHKYKTWNVKKKGFITAHAYNVYIIKSNGFKSKREYDVFCVKKRGFNSYKEYEHNLAVLKGFLSNNDYKINQALKRGFKSRGELAEYWAKKRGFKSYHGQILNNLKKRGFKSQTEYRNWLCKIKGFKNYKQLCLFNKHPKLFILKENKYIKCVKQDNKEGATK